MLGKTVVHMGEARGTQTAKVCSQILVTLAIEAVSEALVLASKTGVDPDRLIDVLSRGLAGNRVMEVTRGNFLEHDFTLRFTLELHHKELGNRPAHRAGARRLCADHGDRRSDAGGAAGDRPGV